MTGRLRVAITVLCLLAAGCGSEGGAAGPDVADTPAATEGGSEVDTEGVEAVPGAGSEVETEPSETESPEATPVEEEPVTVATDGWTVLDEAPEALTEVAAAALGGMILVGGGFDGSGSAVDHVLVYDPTFRRWAAGPRLPAPVHHTAWVSTGEEVLQLGGYAGSGFDTPTEAVHRFDPATGAWEEAAPLPEPRAAGAAAWDGSRVVYAGGVGPDGLAGDVYALDLEAREWSRIGALSEAREHLAAASDGQGRSWFLAGRTGGLDTNLATVDLVTAERVERLGELPTARGGVTGFYHPAAGACAAGGEEPGATFVEVECMDAAGAVTRLPELGTARHGAGATVAEGIAYVLLGGPQPGLTVSGTVEALRVD